MGEIDDAAEVEDQRQAERHQRVECADDQAVEDVEEDDLGHAQRFAFAGQAGGGRAPLFRRGAQVGQVILQPLSSTVPATSAPLTTLVTLKRSSGAEPLACASPTKSDAISWFWPAR